MYDARNTVPKFRRPRQIEPVKTTPCVNTHKFGQNMYIYIYTNIIMYDAGSTIPKFRRPRQIEPVKTTPRNDDDHENIYMMAV